MVYFFPHSSLLLHQYLLTSVLSCVVATIRGFVLFRLWYDCFSQYLSLFYFSSLFQSKWPFFVFLRNILLPIEILKIKILEYSDPPSQYFFINKAFCRSFLRRRKVVLCHLAEWHILPGQVSINDPIDRITPGYRQVIIQFSTINLTNRIRKRNLSTPRQLTTCSQMASYYISLPFNIFTKFAP